MTHKTKGMNIVFIFALIAILSACSGLGKPPFHGETLKQPFTAPEISMTDQNGLPFQLSSLQGKVVLLFFGFLNCPDECPLTMGKLTQAINLLGDRSADVQVVLVSTDPVRDTPQAMKDYLANFSTSFLGITGTKESLEKIWQDYGVVVLDGGETHSSYTYVIDQSGKIDLTFTPEMAPQDMAADIEQLLQE